MNNEHEHLKRLDDILTVLSQCKMGHALLKDLQEKVPHFNIKIVELVFDNYDESKKDFGLDEIISETLSEEHLVALAIHYLHEKRYLLFNEVGKHCLLLYDGVIKLEDGGFVKTKQQEIDYQDLKKQIHQSTLDTNNSVQTTNTSVKETNNETLGLYGFQRTTIKITILVAILTLVALIVQIALYSCSNSPNKSLNQKLSRQQETLTKKQTELESSLIETNPLLFEHLKDTVEEKPKPQVIK